MAYYCLNKLFFNLIRKKREAAVILFCFFLPVVFFLLMVNNRYDSVSSAPVQLDTVVFSDIYKKNDWVSGSGPGSFDSNTVRYRKLLQKIFNDNRFQSFVDLGCGHFQIMKQIKVPANKTYAGIDVVPDVIKENQRLYGDRPNYRFHLIDDLRDLKLVNNLLQGVDMLIVKDVLIHLPNADIHYFIENILPNVEYALITNDYSNDEDRNVDVSTGKFRPIDLTYPPFNLKNMELAMQYSYVLAGPTILKRVYIYENPKFVVS